MTVEDLWEAFQVELETERCPCGCSWRGELWMYRDAPDTRVYEHTSKEWCTALQNHWIHYSAGWKHDGRNGYGSRDGTWVDRRGS